YTSRQNWMQVMETTPAFMDIHQRLVQSAVDSQNQSLEKTLDNLIGRGQESPSPLLDYYFGEKALNENPEQYVDYLSALRAIRNKISEYHSDTAPNLETFLNF